MRKEKRGWKWRVLEVYPHARCYPTMDQDKLQVVNLPQAGSSTLLGIGTTAPTAWRNAWSRIKAGEAV
jgi:hypothetical protein